MEVLAQRSRLLDEVRTFFRDKFSDRASIVDFVVIRCREQADFRRNRGVTKSKDNAFEGSMHCANHAERLRRLQGPRGPGPSYGCLSRCDMQLIRKHAMTKRHPHRNGNVVQQLLNFLCYTLKNQKY